MMILEPTTVMEIGFLVGSIFGAAGACGSLIW
jgi:hypothetical protein